MAAKKHSLDIFRTLAAIDRHDSGYFDALTPEEQKGYASPVVMRWASSARAPMDDWFLLVVNERANMHHYVLYDYPDLQYRLLASCGLGARANHEWIAGTKRESHAALHEFILRYWPEANTLEINIILQHLREGTNLKDFLDGTGLAPDELKRVTKLFAL